MNAFYQKAISDDFVWDAINAVLVSRRSSSSFVNICCPMCIYNGEPTPDRKFKCGVKNNRPGVGVHCFRCGFKARWVVGQPLSRRMRSFMEGVGIDEREIKRINLKAIQYSRILNDTPVAASRPQFAPNFQYRAIPNGAKTFSEWAKAGCDDPDFLAVVQYAYGRGEELFRHNDFYWTPNRHKKEEMRRRFIIPFDYKGTNVGFTARSIDPVGDRYYSDVQADYLHNNRAMRMPNRRFVIVSEGALDCLAIDGVGTLGAKLTDNQIQWLNDCDKTKIVVGDNDEAGHRLVDIAVRNNWSVAFPTLGDGHWLNWWDSGIKDIADAVKEYGRLYTLCSILKTATDNSVEIRMKQRIMETNKNA